MSVTEHRKDRRERAEARRSDERVGGSEERRGADDASTFREAMRGVRPIAPREDARAASAPKRSTAVRARRAAAVPHAADDRAAPPSVDAAAAPESLAFRRPGVRDRQFRRLRRGVERIEDELDLHGLTQAEAHPLFDEFLDASRERGLRCVRIVHGKGLRSGGRGPVLKAAVDLWLRRRHEVVAFASARPVDGGTGAVYVLLRA